ncbi:MAG: hypothetical protein A2Z18_10610 [Armatimonadetes bacterium RBG_16_58_9]|nr:MAG: hypothetical protein A2Z18_10610 [Armatimonadetes bacterium RBG_16_58_9]
MPELRMAALALAFAAGILASVHVPLSALALISGGACIAVVFLFRAVPRQTVLILAAAFLLGAARYEVARRVPADDISHYAMVATAFEGTVVSDPDPVVDRVRFVVRVRRARIGKDWIDAGGSVMFNFYTNGSRSPLDLQYGDAARIAARPYVPFDPTNPGRFSWKQYLARHGIHACASVYDASQIEKLPENRGSALVRAAYAAKRHIADAIHRTHPKRYASLIVGVVLGTYSYLSAETFSNFSRTGTLHILAASGYNCYILVLISTPVLMRLRILPKYRNVVVVGLLVMYLLMVGPKPSLLRASIMSGLLLLALPLRRVATGRNLFFAAALIVLAIMPTDLFEVGFQLSFAAVWALISIAPVLGAVLLRTGLIASDRPRGNMLSRMGWKVAGAIGTAALGTTAISLVTGPLVAYYFNYVSLVSIPANMALVLGVPLIFVDGFTSAALAPISVAGNAVGWAGTWVAQAMLGAVNHLGSMKCAAVSVASPSVPALLGYYIVLYAGLNYVRSRFAHKQSKRCVGAGRALGDRDMDRGVPAP